MPVTQMDTAQFHIANHVGAALVLGILLKMVSQTVIFLAAATACNFAGIASQDIPALEAASVVALHARLGTLQMFQVIKLNRAGYFETPESHRSAHWRCALRRSLRLLCMQRRCMRGRSVPERVWWSDCGQLHCMCVGELQQYGRRAYLY